MSDSEDLVLIEPELENGFGPPDPPKEPTVEIVNCPALPGQSKKNQSLPVSTTPPPPPIANNVLSSPPGAHSSEHKLSSLPLMIKENTHKECSCNSPQLGAVFQS